MERNSYKRITTKTLHEMKANGEKISMLTAYDFTFAKIIDAADIDIILVGDSASNVFAGNETTVPITLDEMIYHAKSVVRAVKRCLIVVDLPFGSYQGNSKKALDSAIRIMKESGAHAVKMEGGHEIIESVQRILTAGIPVMGHLGILPQTEKKFTYKGKKLTERNRILKDAKLLEEAGIFSVVLECIETKLAKKITQQLNIITVGIGSSANCDGQVLVIDDLIAYKLENGYRLVVNCATRGEDLKWISSKAKEYEVEMHEREDLSMLAIQGPRSSEVLSKCPAPIVRALESKKKQQGVFGNDMFATKTGYTGEIGFEVILPHSVAAGLWKNAVNAGAVPIGLGARDTPVSYTHLTLPTKRIV